MNGDVRQCVFNGVEVGRFGGGDDGRALAQPLRGQRRVRARAADCEATGHNVFGYVSDDEVVQRRHAAILSALEVNKKRLHMQPFFIYL